MTMDQGIVFVVLAAALLLFIHGRWRYDVVALLALLAVVLTGVVPAGEAFSGFGHPAVVTVAAVLVISRALELAGITATLGHWLARLNGGPVVQLALLTAMVMVASAFMNNVGAMALFMPLAVGLARKQGRSPSFFLMPLAFASLLGGLGTLIGTPPNIIIAGFRADHGAPFGMFDFTPVGGGVALAGFLFIVLVGWRLLPHRKGRSTREDMFHIAPYLSEVRVPEDSKAVGGTLRELVTLVRADVVVLDRVRGGRRLGMPASNAVVHAGDVMVVEADADNLHLLTEGAGLELTGSKDLCASLLERTGVVDGWESASEDEQAMDLMEAVVMPNSVLVGRTALELDLRKRFGLNLLAVARERERLHRRLKRVRFRTGDVLLLQGMSEFVPDAVSNMGCLPLAERSLKLGSPGRSLAVVLVFAAAVTSAAAGLLQAHIALATAAVAMVLMGALPLRRVYESIDWPVIVLLGAMLPVGHALQATGGADALVGYVFQAGAGTSPQLAVTVLLVVTMLLSNVLNNAATAVVMAPIAMGVARSLGVSVDPCLMAVAVGCSLPFLTPIGHQSNTLVMGPGGYRFGDYWRMGLPLSIVVGVAAALLIPLVWPL